MHFENVLYEVFFSFFFLHWSFFSDLNRNVTISTSINTKWNVYKWWVRKVGVKFHACAEKMASNQFCVILIYIGFYVNGAKNSCNQAKMKRWFCEKHQTCFWINFYVNVIMFFFHEKKLKNCFLNTLWTNKNFTLTEKNVVKSTI